MLTPLSQVFDQAPAWRQPKTLERGFELRAGDLLIATLEFQSAFGSLAVAQAAEGRWTFKRVGFFNPRVTVRADGQAADLAVYHPRWTSVEGKLELPGGRTLRWRPANFWATQYAFVGSDDQPLVAFRPGVEGAGLTDLFKSQARVEVSPAASGLPELSLLALLGWYLMILQQDDTTAATAATSAAIS